MNDTQTIKIFDVNNNLVEDFDDQVEKVLISVHGDKYYDVDEDFNLGTASLDLPGNLPAGAPIQVTFTLNNEGILEVTGKDMETTVNVGDHICQSE